MSLLTTEEGYLIRSLDPDGVRHGVYGAAKHGYFEASPNHDAIAFRVADDAQAAAIYAKIASIPGLRPHAFIIANYPSLDDMYEEPRGLWGFGTWVNGGHWSTCEGRMILGYYRLGKYEDVRRSMHQLMKFARQFRMDNPLTEFGNNVYQPHEPINLCYDTFAPAAAMIRGLFEYLYRADGLTILPHIPPGITELEQRFPIRFGAKRLYLRTVGTGRVTAVYVDGKRWSAHDAASISLPYEQTPDVAMVEVVLGEARPALHAAPVIKPASIEPLPPADDDVWKRPAASESSPSHGGQTRPSQPGSSLREIAERIHRFHEALVAAGPAETYEAAHARLALAFIGAMRDRQRMLAEGRLKPLPDPRRAAAAEQSYYDTAVRLCEGLRKTVASYESSADPHKRRVYEIWYGSR